MSNFLNLLERKFGNWAIPGLIKYLAILFVGVFLLSSLRPTFGSALDFDYQKIQAGEFWRIFTFIFAPKAIGFSLFAALFMVFATIFLFIFSDALEQTWGVFRTNLYILWGFLSALAANFLFATFYNTNVPLSGSYLALSIFFAFATINPRFTILLFFILPVQIWILAALLGVVTLLSSMSSLPLFLFVIACLSNYLFFALPTLFTNTKNSASTRIRRRKFAPDTREPFHICHHCGANDQSNPDKEFRVSSQDGNTYCTEHLPK